MVDYDAPATGRQLSTIAKLCAGLRIQEPLEDTVKTFGSAGRLVRELSNRLSYERKKGIKRCPRCGSILLNDFGSGYCLQHGTITRNRR